MPLSQKAAHKKDLSNRRVTMSHQHYREIARIIRALPDFAPNLRAQKASITEAFARELSGTNPNFDRARFVAACQHGDV